MSGVTLSLAAQRDTRPLVVLRGDAGPLTPIATARLEEAGFAVAGAGLDAALTVLLLTGAAAVRLAAIADAVHAGPHVPLLTTMPVDATGTQLRRAMQAGAAGIVLDDDLATTLGPSAAAVAAGQLALPPALGRRLAPRALSHREKEILGLVVLGLTNRQIADRLFVAESTVKTHLSSSLRKLDARSRAEAAALVLDPAEGYGPAILSIVLAEGRSVGDELHEQWKIGRATSVEHL